MQKSTEAKRTTEISKNEEQNKLSRLDALANINGTVTSEGIHIPAGFIVSPKEGENTSENGLVIVDSNGNEYVWIEVPNDGTGPNYTTASNAENNSQQYYTAIASALRDYCKKDANNGNLIKDGTTSDGNNGNTSTYGYKDEWYSGCGIENEQEYTKLYNKMLDSVYKNGGFWIGRYEAGIDGSDEDISLARQTHTDITADSPKAVSKPNCIPYNFVKCSDAQKLASNVIKNGTNTSSLMFGIQWDLILKFLSTKGIPTNIITGENGKTIGNYHNNTFIINRGKYSHQGQYNEYLDYRTPTENKVTYQNNVSTKIGLTQENRILVTTGAADISCQKNIFDLAGNVIEYTLEKSSMNFLGADTSVRGGCFCNISTTQNAMSLRVYYILNNASYYTGFRVCIF